MNLGCMFRYLGVCLAIMGGSSKAMAADLPGPAQTIETEGGWEISIAPFYGWISGLNGDIATFGLAPVAVDVTPLDLIENIDDVISSLDVAIIGAGEIRKGDFGVFADLYYLDLSTDLATPGPLFSSVEVGTELLIFTALGSYRVLKNEAAHLDALAGLRVWSVDVDLDLAAGILPAASFSDGDTWVDPVVGLKGRTSLSEHTYVTGWAMIGGFDVSSDFMWDVFGSVGYEANDWLSLVAGFRATGVDYQNGGFLYDIIQYGPIIGAVVRF